jgi:DNA-binding transcriptional MocR family regulator
LTARYIQLADRIIADIENEQLEHAQRMPSIRKFSHLYDISITTALNCYQRLEDLGWLQAKAQSGYYVTKPLGKNLSPEFPSFDSVVSEPQSFKENNMASNSPFYVSQFSAELLPIKILEQCFRRANKNSLNVVNLYPEYQGQKALREVLAKHFSELYFKLSAEKLVITNGCIDAIRTAIEVTTKAGDTVAISSPCFIGLIELLANMGRLVIEISFQHAELGMQQLENHMKKGRINACLFSANHINPQGNCLSSKQKEQLAALAENYRIPIIEDDIYLELNYRDPTPLPIKHWDKSGWVLWCHSVSKTIGPGYRIGWCEPGRYFTQYLVQRSVQYFGINIFVQRAIMEFYYSGQYLKHIKKLRLTISQHLYSYSKVLLAHLPKNTRLSSPQGGLVLWVQIPGLNSNKLLVEAAKQNIHFRTGSEFSTLGFYQDCFRINFGWPITQRPISDDVKNDDDALHRYQQLVILCELVSKQLILDGYPTI